MKSETDPLLLTPRGDEDPAKITPDIPGPGHFPDLGFMAAWWRRGDRSA